MRPSPTPTAPAARLRGTGEQKWHESRSCADRPARRGAGGGTPADLPRPPTSSMSYLAWNWYHDEDRARLGIPGAAALLLLGGELVDEWHGLHWPASHFFRDVYAESGHPTLAELSVVLDDLGFDGGKCVLHSWGSGSEWASALGDRPDAEVAELTASISTRCSPTSRPPSASAACTSEPRTAPWPRCRCCLPGRRPPVRRGARAAEGRAPRRPGPPRPRAGHLRADHPRARRLAGRAACGGSGLAGKDRRSRGGRALEKAFAKEKQDVPMSAMLDALQAFGKPVEDYLRPAELADQARKAVAKGLPKDLDWFPWDKLPSVQWAAGGDVPLEVLQWFLSQALKTKSPEPNALLRTYTSMFEPRGREELGQFVLEAWVAEDTRTFSADEARQQFGWEASHLLDRFQWYPEEHTHNPLFGRSPGGDCRADSSPGRCAGWPAPRAPPGVCSPSPQPVRVERAAPVVQRYLKRVPGPAPHPRARPWWPCWPGSTHPGAVQVLLSVGSRFRSKSIQAEANKQAQALAERKGWTLDRAGGPHPFRSPASTRREHWSSPTATASSRPACCPDLSVELRSPEDKVIKTLPAARVADDVEAGEGSEEGTHRHEEGARGGARAPDRAPVRGAVHRSARGSSTCWQRYVLGHPVMRHLATRLGVVRSTGPAGVPAAGRRHPDRRRRRAR